MAQLKDTTVNGTLNATNQVQEQGVRVYSPNNEPSCVDIVPQIKTDTTEIKNNVNSLATTVDTINTNVNQIETAVNTTKNILEGTWDKTLQNSTWGEINAISKAGMAANVFNIGDTKTFTLGGVSYTARIVGFNHDVLANGGRFAGITFEMTQIYTTPHVMNSENTNVGGWKECEMRNYLRDTVFGQLETSLRKVIKPVIKKTTQGNALTAIDETADRLWLFSKIEVDSTETAAGYSDEGETYQYYLENTGNSARIKQRSGSANYWWLRSPSTSSTNYFRCVFSNGYISGPNANFTAGVSFGFCI